MEHSQQLVESLQEDLASSKGRCDGLEQAVRTIIVYSKLCTSNLKVQNMEDFIVESGNELHGLSMVMHM